MSYFEKKEFNCKCGCKLNNFSLELMPILEDVREHFKEPCIIHSACRCPTHNEKVGGVISSKHLFGNAVDFHIKNYSTDEVARYLNEKYPTTFGIGQYDNFIHFDIRKDKARWKQSQFNKKENNMPKWLKNIDFQMVGNVVTTINPVAGLVIKSVDTIVNSDNEHISNEAAVKVIEAISKSTKNDVDDKLIKLVKCYLADK